MTYYQRGRSTAEQQLRKRPATQQEGSNKAASIGAATTSLASDQQHARHFTPATNKPATRAATSQLLT
jgi:hypothetical protein